MLSTDSSNKSVKNPNSTFVKILAIIYIARWYNIFLISISLYAIQIFIFENSIRFLFSSGGINLHFYVLSIDLIVVGGYLINAFYDFEKDMINQPERTYFDRLVSKRSCLNIYMLCNFFGLLLAYLIYNKILFF